MSAIPTIDGKRVYENYSPEAATDADVIVIGSGMGGMACAAALSKYGKRVLLLERHYVPGGFTHSFARKGFVWDAGVHAIGEMREKDIPGRMLRWLTGNQVEMVSLGNPYDRFAFHDGYKFALPDNRKQYVAALHDAFPEQVDAIDRYVDTVWKAAKAALAFFGLKSLPEIVDVIANGAMRAIGMRDYWGMTTKDVLDECGIQGKLRTILTLHWGYYGSIPSESSFAIHALTHVHFWNGGYYPRGGSKQFAAHMLDTVRRAGGKTLVKAEVSELLMDGDRAVGVVMADGHAIRAPAIVSAAGAKTTVRNLVPESARASEWGSAIESLGDSPPYICLNIGFEGDIRKAGASATNLWLFETWSETAKLWDVSDSTSKAPILYCSFPSLKDPDHDPGPRQRHTGECITFVDWDLFQRWADSELKSRPDDYDSLKDQIESRLLAHLHDRIPEIMQHATYWELSTPLTTQHFVNAPTGAIYGLEASPQRFTCTKLRTRTPIPGFYMSGVDIASLGVVGAMTSGMLTAATIDPRVYTQLL